MKTRRRKRSRFRSRSGKYDSMRYDSRSNSLYHIQKQADYMPIERGNMDGNDESIHDHGIVRAMKADCMYEDEFFL